jgi:hypothetical protein
LNTINIIFYIRIFFFTTDKTNKIKTINNFPIEYNNKRQEKMLMSEQCSPPSENDIVKEIPPSFNFIFLFVRK